MRLPRGAQQASDVASHDVMAFALAAPLHSPRVFLLPNATCVAQLKFRATAW